MASNLKLTLKQNIVLTQIENITLPLLTLLLKLQTPNMNSNRTE